MRVLETQLSGPLLLEPVVRHDDRGFFLETYRRSAMAELGIGEELVQHNHSRSHRGVVRGMHFQSGMGKLLQCVHGAVFDVLVDIRRGSPEFGRWQGFELDDAHSRQLWCPDGFAHGFCALTDTADLVYGCTAYYDPAREGGFRFDDPEVGISWPPGLDLIPSPRDRSAPRLAEILDSLPGAPEGSIRVADTP